MDFTIWWNWRKEIVLEDRAVDCDGNAGREVRLERRMKLDQCSQEMLDGSHVDLEHERPAGELTE